MNTTRRAAAAALSTAALLAASSPARAQGPDVREIPPLETLRHLGSFTFGSSDVRRDHSQHEARGHAHDHADHVFDAPIGVMGGHVHEAGSWMVSLRFMQMHMAGMRSGQSDLTNAEVFAQGFLVTPIEMDTFRAMLGGMYAVSNDLTLMLGVPYVWKSMDHVTGMGGRFTTESEGIGDVRLIGLYNVVDQGSQRVHLNLGISFPTGSTDERNDTPAMADAVLPYPMQLGTGTVDLLPGATYSGHRGHFSWGAQGIFRVHLGENDEGYTVGDRFDSSVWLGRHFDDAVTLTGRVSYAHWENHDGADARLNPAVVPTADPDLRGGDRIDLLFGASLTPREGALAGHRFALEWGVPVYQDLDGPQLETDWILTLGWQAVY